MSKTNKHIARQRRHVRVRRKVSGTTEKPRLSVCCTSKHIYVQLIDDSKGCTVAATSSLDKTFREEKQAANLAGAEWLGKAVAAKAIAVNVTKAVFDRGGFRYHGRVKAIADAARAGGLQF